MQLYGYGEDALTLWALQSRLPVLLSALGEACRTDDCTAIYRPSFGRKGGAKSAQIGEFDLLLLTPQHLYLGESKWSRSTLSTDQQGAVTLDDVQILRHQVLRFYIQQWFRHQPPDWAHFLVSACQARSGCGITKPLAPQSSLLARNLEAFLRLLGQYYGSEPTICDILLYLVADSVAPAPTGVANAPGFRLVILNCCDALVGSLVQL